jgi:transaldolase
MTNKLTQLREMTAVVADSGDIEAIRKYQPLDATTNPSLLLQAARLPAYLPLVEDSIRAVKADGKDGAEFLTSATGHFAIEIGKRILEIIPGRVSTEVDARLSFDRDATVIQARRIVEDYDSAGVSADRILIKIAATWEGIAAAKQLEREGINCNLTLLFGFSQAVACADAGVFLISPFVGRIFDWHVARGEGPETPATDPGVLSVRQIYQYYKEHDYSTVVMGASFRNAGQIEELAGCDRLTISPGLLEELEQDNGELVRRLDPNRRENPDPRTSLEEKDFRWALNEDEMATDKLSDGIRKFTADQEKLETLFAARA